MIWTRCLLSCMLFGLRWQAGVSSSSSFPRRDMATITVPPPVHDLSSVAQTPLFYETASAVGTCKCNLQMEYPSHELAKIVMTALSVDPELQPDKVSREIRVEGRTLLVSFVALEARVLRSAFTGFMDMLLLATSTIEDFSQLPLVSPVH